MGVPELRTMQNQTEISKSDEKSQWPPQPDRNYRVSKSGVSQIEFDGQFLRCRMKTTHPFAFAMIGPLCMSSFKSLQQAWEFFRKLTVPPYTLLHHHPAVVFKLFIAFALYMMVLLAAWIWFFRVRNHEVFFVDLESRTFKLFQPFEPFRRKARPMAEIIGVRVKVAPTLPQKQTFIEVGVVKGRRQKPQWRVIAFLLSQADAQTVLNEISEFTGILIVT
jgi:hypothetical protein